MYWLFKICFLDLIFHDDGYVDQLSFLFRVIRLVYSIYCYRLLYGVFIRPSYGSWWYFLQDWLKLIYMETTDDKGPVMRAIEPGKWGRQGLLVTLKL